MNIQSQKDSRRLLSTYHVTPMLAYNMDNKCINPDDLTKHLLGAQVLVYFNLVRFQ
jgi:hypothetical protein